MKKISTFLLTTFITVSVLAQPGDWRHSGSDNFERHDISSHADRYNGHGNYYFSLAERNEQFARIDRFYNWKIREVQNRFYMSRRQKVILINNLESDRRAAIHTVNLRFYDKRNRFGDYHKKGRKYKKQRW